MALKCASGPDRPLSYKMESRREGPGRRLWVIHAEENAVGFALAAAGRRDWQLRGPVASGSRGTGGSSALCTG